ncbi:calcium signal-modulating cyclophilin ligand [Elysia marginata]|uniref:Calcium signal-modulating cyclophilin ligand n=1 Tax=Elysia marginata TaxID=1093978 RepID=A0AAV4FNX2_9GAST|nr:calcium signal-modulating cyclophilin ligand [Elysia marginata]
MSDLAAAQREARRRKITQNAQARMNKLLGRPDLADTESKEVSSSLTPQSSPVVESSKEDGDVHQTEPQSPLPTQNSPYNLRRRPQRSDPPTVPVKKIVTHVIQPTELRAPTEEIVAPASTETKHLPTADGQQERPVATPETTETFPLLDSAPQAQASTSVKNEIPNSTTFDAKALELFRIVVCITTSFVSRSVLRFGFGLFMVESIFLPFFAMEIFFAYIMETYLKDVSPVQSQGTMISAALMLCGIKPELMGIYHKIMSHVAIVTSDFSVYFFSFVIWNALIS